MCGIVGVVGREQAATWASRGLYALQHRGHDSCGVAWLNEPENSIEVRSGMGAVADVLPDSVTKPLPARAVIGQNLYTTFGHTHSTQPFGGRFWDKEGRRFDVALVHNGQICGIEKLRRRYPVMYRSESDTEIIFSLLPHMPGTTLAEKVRAVLGEIEGAYSLLFLHPGGVIAARDARGFRPLTLAEDDRGGVFFASELNAFDLMNAKFTREVAPGEMVEVSLDGSLRASRFCDPAPNLSQCVFEHIYFARPDNQLFGKAGYSTQRALGRQAARELKGRVDADIVIAVPDSANVATLGFADELGLPFEIGLIRHHYAARTFITRGQSNREEAVRLKFNVIKDVVKGRRVILGDDSLVRATTSRIVISMLRQGGAREVRLVLFSPPITHPCHYGINMASPDELVASRYQSDTAVIARQIGADSVHYLSLPGLREVMGADAKNYCYACMTGSYPVTPDHHAESCSS